MTDSETTQLIDQIFRQVFGRPCNWTLDQVRRKFAFDINLPTKVVDALGTETWVAAASAERYITQQHSEAEEEITWEQQGLELKSLDDLIAAWQNINHFTTERIMDSSRIAKSDTIYSCENVYHSVNCYHSKNLVFCDDCNNSECLLASSRSGHSNFCIRLEDSSNSSNSFGVIYSNKIVNSLFIQDCADMYECMFCAHQSAKRFCIANQVFPEEQYRIIKAKVIDWILS